MLGQKNKTHIVVGKDVALVTASQTRADLTAGKIGIFKNGTANATVSALTAGDSFKVVYMDVDGNVVESPVYQYNHLKQKNATNYVAGTEQKTYVGYNGTTGSITAANSSDYYIHMTRKDWSATWGEHGNIKLAAAYKSDASATETEIADALVANASRTFQLEKAKSGTLVTKVSRINSEAVTATDDFYNTVTVVNGEAKIVGAAQITITGTSGTANVTGVGGLTKLATFDTNVATTAGNFVTAHAAAYAALGITVTNPSGAILLFTPANATIYFATPVITNATGDLAGTVIDALSYDGSGSAKVVANDYVRLGATTTTATTVTSSVYKVLSVSGNTAVLDIPVVEASGTYAAGSGYTEVLANATAIAENWGICFESAPVKFDPGKFKHQNITFDLTLSDAFGSTIITEATSAYKGIGTYREVAEIEWELRGNRGEGYKVASFPVSQNLNAISTKTYDMIYLGFEDDSTVTLDGRSTSFHGLVIATEDESSATAHTTLKTVFGL